jgi:Protein of unknown function (DUF3991)/Toprim-like
LEEAANYSVGYKEKTPLAKTVRTCRKLLKVEPALWLFVDIDNLHAAGLIYSDAKQNAVFVMRAIDLEITGAFLRGTYGFNNTFYGLAKGSKRSKGWFHFTIGGQGEDKITRAVLAKSPIEALSVAALEYSLLERTIYIAVDSPRCMPIEFLSYFKNIVAAYENDAAGKEIFEAIQKILPQTSRLKPKARDWNQQLIQVKFGV